MPGRDCSDSLRSPTAEEDRAIVQNLTRVAVHHPDPGLRALRPARWPVWLVLGLGVAVRVLSTIASGPVSLYLNDSRDYLTTSKHLVPGGYHPIGYPLFLFLVRGDNHPLLLTWIQHGLGLATGGLVLAAALRLGLPAWAAALAAAPVLLDPYQVLTEQTVVAETLAGLLLMAAPAVLVVPAWRPATPRRWAGVGLLLAAAVLVRTAALAVVAVVVVAVAVGYLAGRRRGTGPRLAGVLALAAALVVPLAGYGGWFAARHHGEFALSEHGGVYLYGRLAPFASCPPGLSAGDRTLCDPRPTGERPQPDFYIWQPGNPAKRLSSDVDVRSAAMTRVGHAMAEHDPGAWLTSTGTYIWHVVTFGPWRSTAPRVDSTLTTWLADPRLSTEVANPADVRRSDGHRTVEHTTAWATSALRGYQRVVGTPWPLLTLLLAAGVVPAVRRRRPGFGLLAAAGAALLVLPSVTVGWDVRFLLPALGPLGLAAVLAVRRPAPDPAAAADEPAVAR